MKLRLLPLLLLLNSVLLLYSCNDQCTETRYVRQIRSVTLSLSEVRAAIETEAPRKLERPGKLYTRNNYLFINELKKGIHIIDNSNPSNPEPLSFIKIPGNGDIAVRGNIMYADSYSDVVVLDISNPKKVVELIRINDLFESGNFDGGAWMINRASNETIFDQEVSYEVEKLKTNCEDNVFTGVWRWNDILAVGLFASSSSLNAGGKSSSGGDGVGGSMARFALYNQFLYTVDHTNLNLLDISNPEKPVFQNKIPVGWNIETIFPYKNHLFIGSSRGMYIYDISNPSEPEYISVYEHNVACDPVVVHENLAYVTLRSGTMCNMADNQLDVIDISNISNPKLLKSYPMKNPHGLSVDNPRLYLCEGEFGLKVFDVSNPLEIDKSQISHIEDINAFDVISLGSQILLIGKDGFYQYNADNPKQLKLLSKIPVYSPI
jgi:hypothetical protein